jgi:hypothetical protein
MSSDQRANEYEWASELLWKLGELRADDDPASRREALDVLRRILDAYHGPAHLEIHRAIVDYLPTADTRSVADLMCTIAVRCRDSIELVVHMLALLMQVVEWDGVGMLDDVPRLADPQFDHIDGGMTNTLMNSADVSRDVVEQLRHLLASNDRMVVLAALLYVLAWLHACAEDVDLSGFMPILDHLQSSDDQVVRAQSRLARQIAVDLQKERKRLV